MVMFKKTWRNNISFKKETEKIVLSQVKDLIQIIAKFRTEMHVSIIKHVPLLRGTYQILYFKYCVAARTLKRNKLEVYISLLVTWQ